MAYVLIVASSFVFLTGSALWALRWALRSGQFKDSERTALSIFDDEEPVGEVQDRFPNGAPRAARR
jgi:cbb3-type cytochrome oxidase maturation protein